jgi:NADH dehydrogenase FAD-containing subunit
MRIVVLGGGFGGVATVRHLERVLRRRKDVEFTHMSREKVFVLTPLLVEREQVRQARQLVESLRRWQFRPAVRLECSNASSRL